MGADQGMQEKGIGTLSGFSGSLDAAVEAIDASGGLLPFLVFSTSKALQLCQRLIVFLQFRQMLEGSASAADLKQRTWSLVHGSLDIRG